MTRQHYAISVMAQDRVGIIHAITTAISDLDGDITDLSQTVLRGYFAMILLASFPAETTEATIRATLVDAGARLGLQPEIGVKVLDVLPTAPPEGHRDVYVLTASGADRIGFVATVTGFCAQHGINILDLDTRPVGSTYVMLLLVDLVAIDPRAVHTLLLDFSAQTGLRMTLQHYDVFQATQEINMP